MGVENRPGAHYRAVQNGGSPDLDDLLPLCLSQRTGSFSDENVRGEELVDAVLVVGLQLQRLCPERPRQDTAVNATEASTTYLICLRGHRGGASQRRCHHARAGFRR